MTTDTPQPEVKPKKKKEGPKRGGAPLGNQNALGCTTSGAPKKWDPVQEAKYMIEWVKDPDHYIFNELYAERGYCPQRASEWEKICVEFADAYNNAKLTISGRRERMCANGALEKSVYHRHQFTYDKHLHRMERAEKEFDANLAAKKEQQSIEEIAKNIAEGVCRAQKS